MRLTRVVAIAAFVTCVCAGGLFAPAHSLPHIPPHAIDNVEPTDVRNVNGGPIVQSPKLLHIYYGSSWTSAQMNVLDNFAANVGASAYWTTVQSLTNVAGQASAPAQLVRSLQEAAVAPGALTLAGLNGTWQAALQLYATARQVARPGDFDLAQMDLANTVVVFLVGPGFTLDAAPPYCGLRWRVPVTLPASGTRVFLNAALLLYGGAVASGGGGGTFGCNFFGGGWPVGFDSTATIDTMSPHADASLDSLVSVYVRQVVDAVTDPFSPAAAPPQAQPAWRDLDDDHYDLASTTFTQRGGRAASDAADLCAYGFGKAGTVPQYYNTNNPSGPAGPYRNAINANLKLPVTVGTGSPYYLVQLLYYYRPPHSQCVLAPSEAIPLANTTRRLTFVNAYPDGNQYRILLQYNTLATVRRKVWLSPPVAYGDAAAMQKVMLSPTIAVQISVVRAADGVVVYTDGGAVATNWTSAVVGGGPALPASSPYPLRLDASLDGAVVVLSADAGGGNMQTSVHGVAAPSPNATHWLGVNLKYAASTAAAVPAVALLTPGRQPVAPAVTTSVGGVYSATTATYTYYSDGTYRPPAPTQMEGFIAVLGSDPPVTLPTSCVAAGCVSFTIFTPSGTVHANAQPLLQPSPMPTPAPTALPSSAGPTVIATAAPTAEAGTNTTLAVAQALVGLPLTTARLPSFRQAFAAALAGTLAATLGRPLAPAAVGHVAAAAMDTATLGVALTYTVTFPASLPTPAVTAALVGSNAQVSTALFLAGFPGIQAAPPVLTTFAPTAAPTPEPGGWTLTGAVNLGAVVGGAVGGGAAVALAAAARFLLLRRRVSVAPKLNPVVPV
jgi:hypothetical protein